MLSPIQVILINTAIFFGHYVIISASLNFQFGNGGIPNMASNVSVAIGAYTVSSIVLRITMWIGAQAGLVYRPDWTYDNPYNVGLLNDLFSNKPLLGLSIIMLSLGLAFVMGCGLGWVIGALSGRLRATRLMILLFIISDGTNIIVANNEGIAGGTIGAFIPNYFAWYSGEQMIIIAVMTLSVGLFCYLIMNTMMNSPFGRLMRAVRDNEISLASTGKNVTEVRRQIMMFGSGIMAISGVLLSFYFSFVQYTIYDRVSYTFWPWLMITIGGLGNNAGSYVGTLVSIAILKGLTLTKQILGPMLIGSQLLQLINYFEYIILGGLLLVFLMFRPKGLIPEKNLHIKGINYVDLILLKERKRR